MLYTPLTCKAMKIAYAAHHGQVDYNGIPYIFHPIHLAEAMEDAVFITIQKTGESSRRIIVEGGVKLADIGL